MKKWTLLFLVFGVAIAFGSLTSSCTHKVCPAYGGKPDDSPTVTTKKGTVKRKKQKTFY